MGYDIALAEARAGFEQGGIPIGSCLERDGQTIGRGHNLRVQRGDPTAHAEITALRNAGRIGSYANTTLYTTLAPCFLCTGAVILFGIPRVVIGEARTFDGEGSLELLSTRGVEVVNLDDNDTHTMMASFIAEYPELWMEDIGH